MRKFLASLSIAAIAALAIAYSAVYQTPEGNVHIVKRFGEAIDVTAPGLHFKIPFADTVDLIDVRTIKNTEHMQAATIEQMPVDVTVSMNWIANRESILNLYKDYGTLEQFETRVLDPKFRAIAKEAIAKFKAEETIAKRDQVEQRLRDTIVEALAPFPIRVSNINIENIGLPENYLRSIEVKQTEKNLADAEVFKLEKQNLEAQRAVNTARADAESVLLKADANAKAIAMVGKAEASAIYDKAKALAVNPNIVQYTWASNWNGIMPTTMAGDGMPVIMDMRNKK